MLLIIETRDRGVASLVGVPVADARAPGHLAEPPVELVGRIGVAVLVAEHEVVVVPGVAGCPALVSLPGPVYCQPGDRALGEFERALGLGRLGVAAFARRAPGSADRSSTPGCAARTRRSSQAAGPFEAARALPHETSAEVVGKIIYLRTHYHFGPIRSHTTSQRGGIESGDSTVAAAQVMPYGSGPFEVAARNNLVKEASRERIIRNRSPRRPAGWGQLNTMAWPHAPPSRRRGFRRGRAPEACRR